VQAGVVVIENWFVSCPRLQEGLGVVRRAVRDERLQAMESVGVLAGQRIVLVSAVELSTDWAEAEEKTVATQHQAAELPQHAMAVCGSVPRCPCALAWSIAPEGTAVRDVAALESTESKAASPARRQIDVEFCHHNTRYLVRVLVQAVSREVGAAAARQHAVAASALTRPPVGTAALCTEANQMHISTSQ
jgi:hypothetical protein